MKALELLKEIKAAGGEVVRNRGDHWIIKFPDGRVLSLPHGGRQTEVSKGMLATARRLIRENADVREGR